MSNQTYINRKSTPNKDKKNKEIQIGFKPSKENPQQTLNPELTLNQP